VRERQLVTKKFFLVSPEDGSGISTYSRQSGWIQWHIATHRRKGHAELQPAPIDHGIKFKRKGLQEEPTIDTKIDNLKTVERATTIGEGSVRVHTVEHVLAALFRHGGGHAIVEMDANEPPIGDGSASAYVELIKEQGLSRKKRPEDFLMHANRCIGIESRLASRFVAGR